MAASITSLNIEVKSNGITEATTALTALVKVASDAGVKVTDFTDSTKAIPKELPIASSSIEKLVASFKQQSELLGASTAKINEYKLSLAKAAPSQIELGVALGSTVDAYKSLQKSQSDAIKMNMSFDASAKTSAEAARAMQTAISANSVGPTRQIRTSALADIAAEAGAQKSLAAEVRALALAEDAEKKISQSRDMQTRNSEVNAYNAKLKELTSTFKTAGDAEKVEQAISEKRAIQTRDVIAANDKWISSLTREAGAVGLTGEKLRSYNADLLRAEAAQRGVSAQAEPMIKKLQETEKASSSAHSGIAGISRELIVMAHEVSQGQFTRLGGSALVMAEKLNVVPNIMKAVTATMVALDVAMAPIIISMAAVVAAIGVLGLGAVTFLKSQQSLKEFRNEVVLSGGAAGATGDQFYDMANKIGSSTGALGKSREAMELLVKSGKFSSEQIKNITEDAVNLEKYGGVAIEKTISQFEKLSKEPLSSTERSMHAATKAAVEWNESLHFLEPTILAQALAYENLGENSKASELLINSLHDVMKERTKELKENMTDFGRWWDTFTKGLEISFNHVFEKDSSKGALDKLKAQLVAEQSGAGRIDEFQRGGDETGLIKKIAEAQAKYDKETSDSVKKANDTKIKGAADIAIMQENQFKQSLKNEDRVATELEKHAIRQKEISAADALSSTKNAQSSIEYAKEEEAIRKKFAEKVKKPESEGLTGMTAALALISKEEDAKKFAAEQEIKRIDSEIKYGITSLQEGSEQKASILKQEYKDFKDSIDNQIKYIDEHPLSGKKLTNEQATVRATKVDIGAKAEESEKTRTLDIQNKLANDVGSEERTLQKSYEAKEKTTRKEIELLKNKHTAYESLSEDVRKLGVTDKQMADSVTQAAIDTLESQNKSILLTETQIARNKEEIDTLTAKRDAQKTNEADDATNAKNVETQKTIKETSKKIGDDLADAILEGGSKGYLRLLKQMELDFAKAVLRPLLSPITDELGKAAGGSGGGLSGALQGFAEKGISSIMSSLGIGGSALPSLGLDASITAPLATASAATTSLDFLQFADGGNPPVGKQSLVGERGPELFVPKQAGTIIPAGQFGSKAGQTISYSPVINIDSRSDAAQIYSMVNGAVKQGNADLIEGLSRAGKI